MRNGSFVRLPVWVRQHYLNIPYYYLCCLRRTQRGDCTSQVSHALNAAHHSVVRFYPVLPPFARQTERARFEVARTTGTFRSKPSHTQHQYCYALTSRARFEDSGTTGTFQSKPSHTLH